MEELFGMFDSLDAYESCGFEDCCFFTGHRKIPVSIKHELVTKLKSRISYLYSLGVKKFRTGGALGFDTIAAGIVFDMRRNHPDMKLILTLPYDNQVYHWQEDDIDKYNFLKENADEVEYLYKGNALTRDEACKLLFERNRLMVDKSFYCISYYNGHSRSGTGYTLKYAKSKGCTVFNINDEIKHTEKSKIEEENGTQRLHSNED